LGLELRKLKESDESAFLKGVELWAGESLHWYTFDWEPGLLFEDLIVRLSKNSRGEELPEGHVPSSMLYGFVDNEIIGRVSIRHDLNDHLRKRGGHIGYSVAPKFRKLGYATEMVKQTLPYCKKIGLNEILITCAVNNIPSWKIIENIGGSLKEEVWDDVDNEMIKKYWVDL